jgi:uncharacterized protein YggE
MSEPASVFPGPSVAVVGTGTAAAPPDVVVLDLAAEAGAQHAATALGEAGAALTRMRDAALVAGVGRADLRSAGTQLWPQTDPKGRPLGYRAVLSLTVRVRDLATASELLPSLVAAGGDAARVQGTRLEHDDPAALHRAARDAAFADARARAEQYAGLAGRGLGPVLEISEAPARGGPGPVGGARMALMASAEALPVEAGLSSVEASVVVRWGLA